LEALTSEPSTMPVKTARTVSGFVSGAIPLTSGKLTNRSVILSSLSSELDLVTEATSTASMDGCFSMLPMGAYCASRAWIVGEASAMMATAGAVSVGLL